MGKEKTNPITLSANLDENINMFKDIFNNDDTIVFRFLENEEEKNSRFCIIYSKGMVNRGYLAEYIIKPLIRHDFSKGQNEKYIVHTIANKVLASDNANLDKNLDSIVDAITYGSCAVLINGSNEAILVDSKGWKTRSISEPSTEGSVRGPNEGFTESININISMIKRRIKNPRLKFSLREIGEITKTAVCVCYIEGIANEKIVKEVNRRLDSISIESIMSTGNIEELIEDTPYGLFKTLSTTERPDSVAGNMLEGRVAIICEGTPFVIVLPFLFLEYFQATEDYYNRYLFASLNRVIRYIGFFLTTSIPAIWLALVNYHQEMIPTPLLLSVSAARKGVPFPTVFEIVAMLFIFEILREAGVRLPKPIGQTISIVGALVLGEAAVAAKIVSPIMVIIAATTGVTSFLVSKMQAEVIYIRIIFLVLASVLGLYGYMFGVFGLFIYLYSLRSFGVPYMLNIGSINKYDIKDTFVRAPGWFMKYSPRLIGKKKFVREVNNKPQKPGMKKGKE